MIQETFKTQLKQIQTVSEKVQSQLKPQLDKATKEGKKVLSQLGSNAIEEKTVAEVIAEIREHNPTLKRLILNLDSATYDTRKQLSWNATMMSAYAKLQAESKFNNDVKPVISDYLTSVDGKIKSLLEKANELKGKVIS
ncbi:hypothetical protein [Alkalimarinus alittae]|uniref:Uncharacterized protein n=1 Tax=Alkalimarinus alittae TaxID=2961619 RepID=A0ABY6MY67_9ALTE|nr:hypothetical protein [Alkalimarinus alittae]UZE94763.1 hypothetical protein NKI27_11810 [Alkalimarinus alittae]